MFATNLGALQPYIDFPVAQQPCDYVNMTAFGSFTQSGLALQHRGQLVLL